LNSAAALVTLDFIKPLRPDISPRQTAWIGRVVIILFMVLSALVAPAIGSFEGLFHYLQTALAFLVPPVVVIFLFGMFWPRAGEGAALTTLMGGHIVSALCFTATQLDWLELHFTLIAGLIFAVSSMLFLLAGWLMSPPSPKQVARFIFRPEVMANTVPGPWWQDYRLYAAVLMLLTLWLVIVFW
jgi:SSS family solute:Na+ symporter